MNLSSASPTSARSGTRGLRSASQPSLLGQQQLQPAEQLVQPQRPQVLYQMIMHQRQQRQHDPQQAVPRHHEAWQPQAKAVRDSPVTGALHPPASYYHHQLQAEAQVLGDGHSSAPNSARDQGCEHDGEAPKTHRSELDPHQLGMPATPTGHAPPAVDEMLAPAKVKGKGGVAKWLKKKVTRLWKPSN